MSLFQLFDLNDNGHVALPDVLGWLFFGTIGLLGVTVVAGMAIGAVVGAGRGVLGTGRATVRTVRRLTRAG